MIMWRGSEGGPYFREDGRWAIVARDAKWVAVSGLYPFTSPEFTTKEEATDWADTTFPPPDHEGEWYRDDK